MLNYNDTYSLKINISTCASQNSETEKKLNVFVLTLLDERIDRHVVLWSENKNGK